MLFILLLITCCVWNWFLTILQPWVIIGQLANGCVSSGWLLRLVLNQIKHLNWLWCHVLHIFNRDCGWFCISFQMDLMKSLLACHSICMVQKNKSRQGIVSLLATSLYIMCNLCSKFNEKLLYAQHAYVLLLSWVQSALGGPIFPDF